MDPLVRIVLIVAVVALAIFGITFYFIGEARGFEQTTDADIVGMSFKAGDNLNSYTLHYEWKD